MRNSVPALCAIALSLLILVPDLAAAQTLAAEPSTQQVGQKRTSSTKVPKQDAELQTILDIAPGVPPEFGADVMIRVVESNKLTDRALKLELLTRAFYLADAAQQPIKRASLPGSLSDTRSGYLGLAFQMNLDRFSLQSRVVNAMLMLDTTKTRELFVQIRFPNLPALGCEEPLVYDLRLFYQALGTVVGNGFTHKEKLEERHLALLMPYVTGLQSHAQVDPLARLLLAADFSPSQLGEMASLFANSLQRLQRDERSFATSINGGALSSLASLTNMLEDKGIPSIAMLRSVREYLVSNFRDVRCAETVRKQTEKDSLPEAVQYFNGRLRTGVQNAQVTPISVEELQGARVRPAPTVHAFWQSSPANDLLAGIKRLRFGGGTELLTTEQRKSFAWTAELIEFVKKLESWKPNSSDELAGDFFHQKSILYRGLIELIPSGPDRLKVVDSFIRYLRQNYFQRESRMEWFWHVDDLLARSAAVGDPEKSEVLQAFLDSGDSVMNFYARFHRWAQGSTVTPAY